MSASTQDYGEPWTSRYSNNAHCWFVDNRDGRWVSEAYSSKTDVVHERIVACVNALKGCPDPQAFVDAVKNYTEGTEILRHHPALAWFGENP